MARYYVGIDLGTSGTKALLISARGRVRATAMAPHPTFSPRPGWSEQRPADWWRSVCRATKAVLRKARVRGDAVGGVGLSGQMHGSVFLDSHDAVLCDALLWNDQRTADECREIEARAGGPNALIKLARNAALTGFTAPKILWLRKHRRGLFRRLRTVLLPKDFVTLKLAGQKVTDVSDASGTLLFDVARREWSDELLERLELDRAVLPSAYESSTVVGEVTRAAARATGLRAGTPVVAGAGDQPAAAIGTGVVRRGVLSATLGTSGVVFAHSDEPVVNDEGLLQSFCHAVPGKWCVFGCMLSAGGSLQWAREVFYADCLARAANDDAREAIYAEMIRDAAKAPGDAGVVFHPYLTGERCPYPHPHARGAFVGATRADTRGQFVRAVLEGITLGMGRQIELVRAAGVPVREVRLAGGGARNTWWRQLQADVYGVRCVALASAEGSALGAALLGAVGAGAFKNIVEATRMAIHVKETYRPRKANTRRYAAIAAWMRATYESLEPLYRRKP